MVKLDILSDPICPWCYIGKVQLDKALLEQPDHPFSIEWHPFQLNPDMPPEGLDRRTYLEAKFGGREAVAEAYARIDEAARGVGVEIDWSRIERAPNTLDAHRLIHWAGIEGKQTAAVSKLFAAYFHEGSDIGDRGVLLDIAVALELDRDVIARLYESGADAQEVAARDAHARERGVSGAPTFVVANRHVVPGAQPPELWADVIAEIGQAAAAPD